MSTVTEPITDTAGNDHSASSAAGDQADAPARRMIAVADLAAHSGNVREDLNLTTEFTESVAAEGVRIPLLVTTGPAGGWRVIEGHRRLAAALQAGLAEVPCDIDPARAGDEAGQYLDMALANSDAYRANYQPAEEAAALFAAHQAGATRTRIRKATGRKAAQVKTALAAGSLTPETRTQASRARAGVTLEELALLAEFDGDQDATEKLLPCLQRGWGLEHAAEQIRQDRAEAAERDKLRAELEAAGVPLTNRMPDGAAWLSDLTHDGQDLAPETHATCPGHGATFAAWNPLDPSFYCTSPIEHGHASKWAIPNHAGNGDGNATSDSNVGSDPVGPVVGARPDPAPDPDRRLVIAGNKAWQAAAQVRHRWLTASLFARRSLPREAQVFAARQLLAMPDPLRGGLGQARYNPMFAKLTGHDPDQLDTECDTATTGRLTIILLAPMVIAYEHAMTEGEGRNTWRTDRYSPCPRRDAGRYLAFLSGIGYELSGIERALVDGTRWTGDDPEPAVPGQPADTGHPHESSDDQDGPPAGGAPDAQQDAATSPSEDTGSAAAAA